MNEKVCIIGAGSSGIVAAKTFKEAGIPFDCFEMGSDIGGNWRYNNDNGRSAAYHSLHIDTSKNRMAYSDFPMPEAYPNYPHHTQIIRYFEEYVHHFGLRPFITCRTCVENVSPAPEGGYQVTTVNLDTQARTTQPYQAVLVCNGHHWHPKLPNFPGSFNGRILHSREYRTPKPFEGQNVLVVGIGNSGVDIACDVCRQANRTFLSTRHSAHIIPRFILGKATDQWDSPFSSRLPFPLKRLLYKMLLYLAVGNQENYGIPKPHHQLLSAHPTLSAELLNLVANGTIHMKPNIKELVGDQICFVDGTTEPVNTIVYATGYKITFPFFAPDFIQFEDNRISLYHKVIHPEYPGLYFIGLIQPLGAIMPLAELQSQWVTKLLTGECVLPDKSAMLHTITQEQTKLQKRYVDSTRHTIQVDFWPYKWLLESEINRKR